jgi:Tfp pilus assembly protein PilF
MVREIAIKVFAAILAVAFISGCAAGEQNRKESVAHYKMGVGKMMGGNNEAALYEFLVSTEKDPYNADSHFMAGVIYYQQQQYDSALDKFNAALGIDSNYSDAHNNIGLVYVKMKKYDKALEHFRKATDNPMYQTRHNAMINIGLVYAEMGDHEKSAEALYESLLVLPTNVKAMMLLAEQYRILDRDNDAIKNYQQVLRFVPGYAPAHYELGVMYTERGENEKAAASFEKVLEYSPDTEMGVMATEQLSRLK